MKHLAIAALMSAVILTSSAKGGWVWGYAYHEGESNHSGIRVQVIRYPFGNECYHAWTDSDGYWEQQVLGGYYYHIKYFDPCYHVDMDDSIWIPIIGSVQAETGHVDPVECSVLGWCDSYPWEPPGTSIDFPDDDGEHTPFSTYPIEWWYANFRLTGETTDKEYGAFVAFFKDGPMRLFAISDLEDEQYFSAAKLFAAMSADDDRLGITYVDQILDDDRWWNAYDCNDVDDEFLYRLNVDAYADQGGQKIALDVYMSCDKAPLMVSGDGHVNIGSGFSYYYSFPRMKVIGVIEVNGVTEYITGEAWFDHQWGKWGKFFYGENTSWEWFSIQLDDDREIMVADLYLDGLRDDSFSGGLNYYDENCDLDVLQDYEITPLSWWWDPVSGTPFHTQWQIQEPTRAIDLVVTAEFENQVMRSLLCEIVPGAIFWEGACSVTGTVGGQSVFGNCYAELTQPGSILDTGGTLATVIPPAIGDVRLRLMLDQYLPAEDLHSSLIVLTQCYGGDMIDNLITRENTAILSATSPCQPAQFGGYDDDAARCLYPEPFRTSDDVHDCALPGKAPGENPQRQGETVSLENTSPSGPIKGRHILFYAGHPDGLPGNPAFSDTAYLRMITENFASEHNTTIYSVCSRGPLDGFDYWATGFGLRRALKDIRDAIGSDEQFIMFVSDHGGKRLVPNFVQCACECGCVSSEAHTIPQSTWLQMLEDTANVPQIVIVSEDCVISACTVQYCGQSYYPVYFDCEDTVEIEVDGETTIGWAAVVDLDEQDVCPDGDDVDVTSSECLDIHSISVESGAITRISDCAWCPDGFKVGNADGLDAWDIEDVVYLIGYIFSGGPPPTPCGVTSGDADCSDSVDLDDVVYLINYIFLGGPQPCSCENWMIWYGNPRGPDCCQLR